MSIQTKTKPVVLEGIGDLYEYYWLKTELIEFCKRNKLSPQGSKSDLIKRIDAFLKTGIKNIQKNNEKLAVKDSLKKITKNTLVKNYNNDAETRKFFVAHLGNKFKFNAYLRQFTKKRNIKSGMTYGDLINGWILFENKKKNSSTKRPIPKQFEYNQFIRDYFSHEKSGTLKKAISAWKLTKSKNGPNTYSHFLLLKKID